MQQPNKLIRFANDLANKYTVFFDVYRDEKLDEFSLPFMAIYRRRDERYMLSKKIKVYGVDTITCARSSVASKTSPDGR